SGAGPHAPVRAGRLVGGGRRAAVRRARGRLPAGGGRRPGGREGAAVIRATRAVARRELRSLVSLPHTYAIAAAFLTLSGIFFVTFLVQSDLPDLEQYYSNIATTLLVLAPIIAMRSFAEERRAGGLDITLSWPVPRTALVAGKYAVTLLYTWALLSVAWLYVRLLRGLGEVEVGKAVAGYVGILLLAAALGALALAVSARASSPTGAAFMGFGLLL